VKTNAIVFKAPREVGFGEFELGPCGPKEIIAETIYTFVSPGTELRVLSGVKESRGRFPIIPGYSWVGRIIEVGREVKGFETGDLVTGRNPRPITGITSLWGGQAGRHRCDVAGYDAVLKLPAGADPWDYVLVEVSAVSWRGTSIASPARGETAVVVGQGLIGAFAARWLLYQASSRSRTFWMRRCPWPTRRGPTPTCATSRGSSAPWRFNGKECRGHGPAPWEVPSGQGRAPTRIGERIVKGVPLVTRGYRGSGAASGAGVPRRSEAKTGRPRSRLRPEAPARQERGRSPTASLTGYREGVVRFDPSGTTR
jgi:hypothetical protein